MQRRHDERRRGGGVAVSGCAVRLHAAKGHSKHEMWMRLCDLCAKHPEEVTGVLKVGGGRVLVSSMPSY